METLYTLGLLRSREESEAALYLPQKDFAEDDEFHSKDGRTESFDTPAQIDKLSLQSKRTSKTVEHHHELEHHHHAQHGARPVKARGYAFSNCELDFVRTDFLETVLLTSYFCLSFRKPFPEHFTNILCESSGNVRI